MLGVQEGREGKGREANGEIAGCTQSTTVNSNANDSILFPARQQNQHSFTVGISNDSRGHECTHCTPSSIEDRANDHRAGNMLSSVPYTTTGRRIAQAERENKP